MRRLAWGLRRQSEESRQAPSHLIGEVEKLHLHIEPVYGHIARAA